MLTNQLAVNIKYYRTQCNWTQQQLADELNISRSVIAKWESGDVLPDLPTLMKLSALFYQSIDNLLGICTTTEHTLSDFQQLYATKNNGLAIDSVDETSLALLDYLLKNPHLRDQLELLMTLPIKHQKAVHRILKTSISELRRL